MKIHQEEVKFKPVTITLETEGEVMLFAKMLGGASNVVVSEFGVDGVTHDKIYAILEAIVGIDRYRDCKGLIVNLSNR